MFMFVTRLFLTTIDTFTLVSKNESSCISRSKLQVQLTPIQPVNSSIIQIYYFVDFFSLLKCPFYTILVTSIYFFFYFAAFFLLLLLYFCIFFLVYTHSLTDIVVEFIVTSTRSCSGHQDWSFWSAGFAEFNFNTASIM